MVMPTLARVLSLVMTFTAETSAHCSAQRLSKRPTCRGPQWRQRRVTRRPRRPCCRDHASDGRTARGGTGGRDAVVVSIIAQSCLPSKALGRRVARVRSSDGQNANNVTVGEIVRHDGGGCGGVATETQQLDGECFAHALVITILLGAGGVVVQI